jgi:hypothetical protein
VTAGLQADGCGRRPKQLSGGSRPAVVFPGHSVAFTTKGQRDVAGWYEGKHLTIVSNADKVWAQVVVF